MPPRRNPAPKETHATRLRDREEAMRATVQRLKQSPGSLSAGQIRQQAERLLAARLHFQRAKLADLHAESARRGLMQEAALTRMEDTINATVAGGIEAILREFRVPAGS